MIPSRTLILLVGTLLIFGLEMACSREKEERREQAASLAADEAVIRAAEQDWSTAAGAKDLDKSVSFYAEDASTLWPGNPTTTGKDGIRKAWTAMLGTPGLGLTFAPTKVEASKSRDLAYVIGAYQLTTTDKKGKPRVEKGKYVDVWKKQADGTWKVVADIFNADQQN